MYVSYISFLANSSKPENRYYGEKIRYTVVLELHWGTVEILSTLPSMQVQEYIFLKSSMGECDDEQVWEPKTE